MLQLSLLWVHFVSFCINETQTFLNLYETIFVNKGFAACSSVKCGHGADRSAKCYKIKQKHDARRGCAWSGSGSEKSEPSFQGITGQGSVPELDPETFSRMNLKSIPPMGVFVVHWRILWLNLSRENVCLAFDDQINAMLVLSSRTWLLCFNRQPHLPKTAST